MASKLDELMALARECGNIERRHCIGKAKGFDVLHAYAALQSALNAVVEENEELREAHLEILRIHANDNIRPKAFYISSAAIDAARKP